MGTDELILILLIVALLAWFFFPLKENVLTTSPGTIHQIVARHWAQDKYLLAKPGEKITDYDPETYFVKWAPFDQSGNETKLENLDYYQRRMLTQGV